MVISINSHGRKSDKETQSPVLKIFKEIMQRENDPDKANLLKTKHEERKKKQYANSKTKSEHKTSGSEKKYRRNTPYKTYVEQRNVEHSPSGDTHTIPFQNEKRDSWWFWGESENLEKKEDTCSRVSCAFRRLISSEYACVSCLLMLFLASVVLAFLLVFKNIPALNTNEALLSPPKLDSEALKRKLDKLKAKRFNDFKYDDDFVGMKDIGDRRDWDDTISNKPDGLSGLADLTNFQDLGGLEGSRFSNDLSSILYNDRLTDEQSSERLKNFYKKLIQTDAQIRNLKKGITNYDLNSADAEFLKMTDRVKRSVKRKLPKHNFHFEHNDKRKDANDKIYDKTRSDNVIRKKRLTNGTVDPTGFVIEERQIVVQYTPDNVEAKKKVPKCSHVPKESKSHEKQLKHPFYKNSQRLDEFLDQFLAKDVPDVMPDAFDLDALFQKKKNTCKHPKVIDKDKDRNDMDDIKVRKADNSLTEHNFGHNKEVNRVQDDGKQRVISTDGYGVLLSISTLLNPSTRKSVTLNDFGIRPPARKLMQVEEEDEESLGYEDLKEVLTEDPDDRDDSDRQGERKKRKDEQFPNQIPSNPVKYNPPGVHNPNWKGPMPLYPDELNSMIKQAAMNANKVQVPHSKDETPESDVEEKEMNDMEYIEDYLNNKYERLVKMAQAYSDYGVLDGKKESVTKANTLIDKDAEKRVKLEAEKKKLINRGVFGRWKKASKNTKVVDKKKTTMTLQTGQPKREGIRFELRPTSSAREDDPSQVLKLLSKHLKISRKDELSPELLANSHATTVFPSELEVVYQSTKADTGENIPTDRDEDRGVIFKIGRGVRSLQSIDLNEDVESLVEEQNEKTDASNVETVDENFKKSFVSINSTEGTHTNNFDNDSKNEITVTSLNNDLILNDNSSNLANETKPDMSISDFFAMLSDWFSFLDTIDDIGRITNSSSTPTKNSSKLNVSSDVIYPSYDSDMVDNIGHRSRVILSIEEKEVNATEEKKESEVQSAKGNNVNVVDASVHKATKSPTNITTLGITTPVKPTAGNALDKDTGVKNKTLVKRNAEDSSLIFWNDIYDDEYGVIMDPIENAMRDKHSIRDRDLLKRPTVWFQDKFKKLKDKIGGEKVLLSREKAAKLRPVRETSNLGAETHQKYFRPPNRICKRETLIMEDDIDPNKNVDFAHLTANMKRVCKKAARAVQQTRNIEVREDAKEGSVATSLMQQLVRLMTDLVDYQVQQKTCLKLPPDLTNFLEWLTMPVPDQQIPGSFKTNQHYDDVADIINMGLDDDIMPSSSEKEESRADTRSECLGTLKAVQELIHQYDAMSDEEKSKMTGVRDYLESQMDYLNRQLASVNDYSVNRKRNLPARYKRDLPKKCQKYKRNNKRKKRRAKRKLQKFMKNFSKKHTRTTASYYENLQVTELTRNDKVISQSNDGLDQNSVKLKRNLKDIYYKALADSKKITTIKDMNKKLDIAD